MIPKVSPSLYVCRLFVCRVTWNCVGSVWLEAGGCPVLHSGLRSPCPDIRFAWWSGFWRFSFLLQTVAVCYDAKPVSPCRLLIALHCCMITAVMRTYVWKIEYIYTCLKRWKSLQNHLYLILININIYQILCVKCMWMTICPNTFAVEVRYSSFVLIVCVIRFYSC